MKFKELVYLSVLSKMFIVNMYLFSVQIIKIDRVITGSMPTVWGE